MTKPIKIEYLKIYIIIEMSAVGSFGMIRNPDPMSNGTFSSLDEAQAHKLMFQLKNTNFKYEIFELDWLS